jgi:hypothetical protein
MWVSIGAMALSFVVTIIMTLQMFAAMSESLSNLDFR